MRGVLLKGSLPQRWKIGVGKAEYMLDTYVGVDLETTGLNIKTDKIIEIGAVLVEDGIITGEFQAFVNPRRSLEEKTTALTGITDGMLAGAKGIDEVFPEFLAFSGRHCLVGHNIAFDFSFLKKAAVNLNLEYERRAVDTLFLSRKLLADLEKKNLGAVCEALDVDNEHAHRALADAKASSRVLEILKKRCGGEHESLFVPKEMNFKIKKEQPATKIQKEHLRELAKCHRIDLPVQIDYLSRNEVSRLIDRIISEYGKVKRGE